MVTLGDLRNHASTHDSRISKLSHKMSKTLPTDTYSNNTQQGNFASVAGHFNWIFN